MFSSAMILMREMTRGLQPPRRRLLVVEHAVDAVADAQRVLERLDVDVGGLAASASSIRRLTSRTTGASKAMSRRWLTSSSRSPPPVRRPMPSTIFWSAVRRPVGALDGLQDGGRRGDAEPDGERRVCWSSSSEERIGGIGGRDRDRRRPRRDRARARTGAGTSARALEHRGVEGSSSRRDRAGPAGGDRRSTSSSVAAPRATSASPRRSPVAARARAPAR